MTKSYDIIVIGGGVAGTMAALRASLYNLRTCLLSGNASDRCRSRAQWVPALDDVPGLGGMRYPLSSSANVAFEPLESSPAIAARLTRVKESADEIVRREKDFLVSWTKRRRRGAGGKARAREEVKEEVSAPFVLLATGIMDIQPCIQGRIDPIFPYANARQALYSLQADGHRVVGQPTVVIGYTDEAAEHALILRERYEPPALTLVTHGHPFAGRPERRASLERVGIDVLESEITAFEGDARTTGLRALCLEQGRIECTRVFVSLGYIVHNRLARRIGASLDERGFVICDADGETSCSGLFVAGDLCSGRPRGVVEAWRDALIAVEAIDGRVRRRRRTCAME